MNTLNILDIIIMIIVLFGMWRGFKMGLIQSVVSLTGWVVAFFMATRFASSISSFFSGIVSSHVLQVSLGFLTIVLIVIAIVHIVATFMREILSTLNLSFLDKIAGGVLGSVRSILVVLVVLSMSASVLVKSPLWHTSLLAPEILPYAPVAKALATEVLGGAWQELNLQEDTQQEKTESEETPYEE